MKSIPWNKPGVWFAVLAALATVCCEVAHAAPPAITPLAGYSVTWDGNDGLFFTTANPAPAPNNLARATMGATPFSDGDIGVSPHSTANLNNGTYGNLSSWISSTATPHFAGVTMAANPGGYLVSSIAWGRDNGNSTDACGGQCSDRSLGVYTLYRTTLPGANALTAVTGNAATGWEQMALINYVSSDDAIVGGGFTSYFRHEFQVLLNGLPVPATAFRIDVPGGGFNSTTGTAIDEIEVFGTAVPEPASIAIWSVLGALGMIAAARHVRRKRQPNNG